MNHFIKKIILYKTFLVKNTKKCDLVRPYKWKIKYKTLRHLLGNPVIIFENNST